MEMSGQLQAPAALFPGKSPWYPLDRRVGGPQSRSGHGGEEKNSQPPPEIEPQNPDLPVRSPALYRLSYHGSPLRTAVILNKTWKLLTLKTRIVIKIINIIIQRLKVV
jgi:hypothetical protein